MSLQISNITSAYNFSDRFPEKSVKGKAKSDGLSDDEKKQVQELKKLDREVRQHELAHMAGGAGIISSGPSFQYRRGPDGVQYAVGGEV